MHLKLDLYSEIKSENYSIILIMDYFNLFLKFLILNMILSSYLY